MRGWLVEYYQPGIRRFAVILFEEEGQSSPRPAFGWVVSGGLFDFDALSIEVFEFHDSKPVFIWANRFLVHGRSLPRPVPIFDIESPAGKLFSEFARKHGGEGRVGELIPAWVSKDFPAGTFLVFEYRGMRGACNRLPPPSPWVLFTCAPPPFLGP
jgi:hypothetical protein